MICTYCGTEYGMSHTPYQCSAILVKQRDDAREQVRVLREAAEEVYKSHLLPFGGVRFTPSATMRTAKSWDALAKALAATESEGAAEG